MTPKFLNEEDIRAAYEAAEFIVRGLIMRHIILVPDERQPAYGKTIKRVAHAVADAVIRSNAEDEDITNLPEVNVEHGSIRQIQFPYKP